MIFPIMIAVIANFMYILIWGEKGLRCYFPMKNLEEGPHLLHLERKKFYGNKK